VAPPVWHLEIIAELMAEAGRCALAMSGGPWEMKSDRTLVTAADRAVERIFAEACEHPASGNFLIGEETVAARTEDELAAAWRETAWIVDPIDGTAPYAHGLPTWGISLALARGGALVEGALFLPVSGEMCLTADGQAWFARTPGPPETWRFTFQPLVRRELPADAGGLISITQNLAKGGCLDLPNPVQAVCSCVYSTVGLLQGRYLAYLGNLALWDLAGSLPLFRALGYPARFRDGRPFPLDRVSPAICHLDPGDPRRWRFRGETAFAATPAALDYVLAGVADPG